MCRISPVQNVDNFEPSEGGRIPSSLSCLFVKAQNQSPIFFLTKEGGDAQLQQMQLIQILRFENVFIFFGTVLRN